MTPTLEIDKQQPTPAYLQLQEGLRRAILGGEIGAGEALPSERDLALSLGLSRMTVRRALSALIAEKLAERRQGSGTYVLPRRLEQTVDRVLGFVDEAKGLGFRAGSELLEVLEVPADPQVAAALGTPLNTPVLRLTRLRTADGAPLAVQVAHLAPGLRGVSLEQLAQTGSLYRTLEQSFHLAPHRARQVVGARLPTKEECARLEITKRMPVLAIERTTYGADDTPFEYVRSAYRGDKYQLGLDLQAP